MSSNPKSDTRYRLDVVKSEVTWAMPNLFGKPSPFIEISLAGRQLHVTATKQSTPTPEWNEILQLNSDDPTSILSINLRRPSMMHGPIRSIGSTQLSIGELEDFGIFSRNISLDLFEMGKKTAVVIVHFSKDEPPSPPVVKPSIPVNVPPELRPDFILPPSLSSEPESPNKNGPKKKMQFVGYQSQDVSIDQVERIVRQILARSFGS